MKGTRMMLQMERIEQIIEGFQNADVLDLALLMEDARFLACQLYPYSCTVGEAKKLYNEAHVCRKLKHAELVEHYRNNEGLRISEAERKAENHADFKKLYKREYDLDASFEKGKMMLNAVIQVHGRMLQEISELRAEKRVFVDESSRFPQAEPVSYQ